MFSILFGGDGPEDFASFTADREISEVCAGEFQGWHPAGCGQHDAARRRDLLCQAAARALMRTKVIFATRRRVPVSRIDAVKPTVQGMGRAACSIAILGLLFSAAGSLLCAAPNDHPPPGQSARDLVREVVRNEESARRNPQDYYKFVQKETTPEGSKTTLQIETAQGVVGKVVSVDNKPPSPEQCRADTNSLKKLATDPHVQSRRAHDQQEQTDRVERLMAAVPDAFIFQYQRKGQGSKWIEVRFHPNPQFQPQSHEASLLKGMRGTLWVDPASHRLVKIDGTLFKDIKFGWGFLASLHQGGHFAMQQSKLPGGSWRETLLQVDLDGSKLVFGDLKVHFKDTSESFDKLGNSPTLADAANMLEQSTTACRESQDKGTTAQVLIP